MSMMPMGPNQLPPRPNEAYQVKPEPEQTAAKPSKKASALVQALGAKGAKDPNALAAFIGRQRFGKAAFAKMAAKGRKNAQEGN